LTSCHNLPHACAEADAGETAAAAVAAQDGLVAVFQKLAEFAGGQADGFRAAPGQFKQAAALLRQRSGDSAAGQQIAGLEVAAVAGVVRE
jgi:hypothetical protein